MVEIALTGIKLWSLFPQSVQSGVTTFVEDVWSMTKIVHLSLKRKSVCFTRAKDRVVCVIFNRSSSFISDRETCNPFCDRHHRSLFADCSKGTLPPVTCKEIIARAWPRLPQGAPGKMTKCAILFTLLKSILERSSIALYTWPLYRL